MLRVWPLIKRFADPEDRQRANLVTELASSKRLTVRAVAMMATAVGAVAVGAFAIGALAIGRLAIRRIVIDSAQLKGLKIEDLTVTRLRAAEVNITDSLETPPTQSQHKTSP
jgi:hypothetical protein